jgi:chromosome segregation ATPase
MRITRIALMTVIAILGLQPLAAQGQGAPDNRLREALRTATVQLRDAEDARARLQASEASLKQELAKAQAELAAARKTKTSARELGQLNEKLADANKRLEEQGEAIKVLTATQAQCESAQQEAARTKDGLQGEAKALKEQLATAERKNARMYAVGTEIIDWLSGLGFGTALAAREPFLGLKRVELENAAQDYEDKLIEARVNRASKP